MHFQRNMGPKERALRVVTSAAFFVVGATVATDRVIRGVLFFLGAVALIAAITGYGPLAPWLRRFRGDDQDQEMK